MQRVGMAWFLNTSDTRFSQHVTLAATGAPLQTSHQALLGSTADNITADD